jgi:DnaJ-domain-containing protein 1
MSTYARTSAATRCDECAAEMAIPLFCDRCGAWYPERRAISPFTLLGLPERFEQDEAAWDRLEAELGRRLHPDAWERRGDSLKKRALLAQSAVNEALAAVRDPFERARTLLERNARDLPATVLPQAFLLDQLELRDAIEEGLDDEARRALKKRLRKELDRLEVELTAAFARADASALIAARRFADEARYWQNAQAALRGEAPH